MKKCFSNIRTLAALLMAGAFAACSSDDNSIEQPATPTAPKTYTLTVNASKGDASTRALALDGTKLLAKWADGDELYVYKAENRAECTSGNKLGTISTVASAISADGDQATFTGTLSGTVTVSTDDKLMLVYHPAAFDITGFEGQAGTLTSASALDCATASVTASVSGSDITIKETSATFTTHTAMLKLTLQDNAATPNKLKANSLKMSMSLGSTTLKEFTFSPTDATYTANGNGVLYFALPSVDDVAAGLSTPSNPITTTQLAGVTITYTATVGSDVYTATKTGYAFAAGKYYAGTLTMAKAAIPLSLTSPAVGQVIGSDGKNYDAGSVPTGVTAVAMIAYVSGSNGLAVALDYLGSGSYEVTYANVQTQLDGLTAFSGGTWRLATKDEWVSMLVACKVDGDSESFPTTKQMTCSGFWTKMAAAGWSREWALECWTSTTKGDKLWSVLPQQVLNKMTFRSTSAPTDENYILPVLAF